MSQPHVAFLGLGIMGSGMARRILSAGFPLTVYNRNPDKAKALGADGAKVASSPQEAARGANVIISMLADDNAGRSLWLGDTGALRGAAKGTLLIESSTVTPEWIKELDEASRTAGCELIDAPVTGSKAAAAGGELNFIVGGTAAGMERARPVLEVMGKTITHLGPVGSGAIVKLINNFVCGAQLVAIAEGIAFLEKSGVDRDKALPVMTEGTPGSPLVKMISKRMTSRDYTPNFLMRLLAKDLRYAIDEAASRSLTLQTGKTALGVLEQGIAAGLGDKDMAAVVELMRSETNRV